MPATAAPPARHKETEAIRRMVLLPASRRSEDPSLRRFRLARVRLEAPPRAERTL